MFRIDHKNLKVYLRQLEKEPYFQPGSTCRPRGWYRVQCRLVMALGELAEDGLKTLALTGGHKPKIQPILANDRFATNGLECKCYVRKPLFNALMNLRDLVPVYRGYIVCVLKPEF